MQQKLLPPCISCIFALVYVKIFQGRGILHPGDCHHGDDGILWRDSAMTLGHSVARQTPRFGKHQPLIFLSAHFSLQTPPATMGFVKGGKQKQRNPHKPKGGNKKQRIDLRAAAAERAAAANAETEADDNDSKMAPSEVPSETETEDSVGKKPRARRLQDPDRKALGARAFTGRPLHLRRCCVRQTLQRTR